MLLCVFICTRVSAFATIEAVSASEMFEKIVFFSLDIFIYQMAMLFSPQHFIHIIHLPPPSINPAYGPVCCVCTWHVHVCVDVCCSTYIEVFVCVHM